ncbi:hypothetical protein [Catenuloplanes japonicus]|uniref:hypothetical protein n=1 Tax=Catenuloplanes japonicus TaxID=33876 RepID=UPI0005263F85|nr:hypothetical protein [Catenuloplanes japonicus]
MNNLALMYTLPRETAAQLTSHALSSLWSATEDPEVGGCCPICCAPCAALKRLLEERVLDDLARNTERGSHFWDPMHDQVDRGWLERAWAVDLGCHERDEPPASTQPPAAACCDMRNRNCEAPADLCCHACTEASHWELLPPHGGTQCITQHVTSVRRVETVEIKNEHGRTVGREQRSYGGSPAPIRVATMLPAKTEVVMVYTDRPDPDLARAVRDAVARHQGEIA